MMRLLTIALCASTAAAAAQDRPTVLTLPAGARALGVGDAYVAGRLPEVIFYNPAQLALTPGTSVSVQRYTDETATGSMASTMTLPIGAIGIGLQYLEFTEGLLGVRSTASLFAPGANAASSMAASLALALPAYKGFRSGVATKFVSERIGTQQDGGTALDIGIAREFFGRSTLAFSAQNLGAAMQIDGARAALPTRYTLGAYAFSRPFWTFFDATGFASMAYTHDGSVLPAGGVELSYVPLDGWTFTGRFGARRVDDRSDATPWTVGAGVSLDRVSLDWAFHRTEGPAAASSHRIGLRVR